MSYKSKKRYTRYLNTNEYSFFDVPRIYRRTVIDFLRSNKFSISDIVNVYTDKRQVHIRDSYYTNWVFLTEEDADMLAFDAVKTFIEEPDSYKYITDFQRFLSITPTDKRLIINDMFPDSEIDDKLYENIYTRLDDPYQYFVIDEGIYTLDELMYCTFIRIEEDALAEHIISMDGRISVLSSYDSDEYEYNDPYYGPILYYKID